MQVKRRINQFFDNIRRKDKGNLSSDEESSPSRNVKKKWKKSKNNQNYSQWDLVENIASDPVRDEEILNREQIQSQIRNELVATQQICPWKEEDSLVDMSGEEKKRKSFLKRSGSLLRRSIRRNKKSIESQSSVPDPLDREDLTDIVQEINQTLVAVANFGNESKSDADDDIQTQRFINSPHPSVSTMEDFSIKIVEVEMHNNDLSSSFQDDVESETKPQKFAIRKGLQRQASKIMSRFQRTSGSLRLKSATSIDSFPNNTFPRRRRSASLNGAVAVQESTDLKEKTPSKAGSFRRKMSFKKARKAMKKGATSIGKNFVHASSVMPVGYECPPVVNYYTDYEAGYPTEIEHYYYRTQSYQPKTWDDERNLQYTRRPAAFYQHGYCYNG